MGIERVVFVPLRNLAPDFLMLPVPVKPNEFYSVMNGFHQVMLEFPRKKRARQENHCKSEETNK